MKLVVNSNPKDKGRKGCFITSRSKATYVRNKARDRWKRREYKEDYQRARNEYVKIGREEEKRLEKDVVERRKDHTELPNRFINVNRTAREGTDTLRD